MLPFIPIDEFNDTVDIPPDEFSAPSDIGYPIDYLSKFFSDEILNLIAERTNEYSVSLSGTGMNVTIDYLRAPAKSSRLKV